MVAEVVKNLPVWGSKGCKRFFLSEGGFKIVSGQDQIKSRRWGGGGIVFYLVQGEQTYISVLR